MRIYKNILNELVVEANSKVFYISKSINRYGIITYKIMRQEPWYRTDAILYDDVFLWINIKPFISWVQAYNFIKENINIIR